MEIPYHQCNETTLRVNRDGRHAGSKSYIWIHITSELYDANPIILFCYELTRGTDHLRKFYEDFKGSSHVMLTVHIRLLKKRSRM